MPYLIKTTDKAGSAELRAKTRAAHLNYLAPWTPRLLAAGGFLEDNGEVGNGGMIIVDTEDRKEAESLLFNDPYYLADLFESYEIRRWRKVFFDGAKQS